MIIQRRVKTTERRQTALLAHYKQVVDGPFAPSELFTPEDRARQKVRVRNGIGNVCDRRDLSFCWCRKENMSEPTAFLAKGDARDLCIWKTSNSQFRCVLGSGEAGFLDLGGKLGGRRSWHKTQDLLFSSERPGNVDGYLFTVKLNSIQSPAMLSGIVKKADKSGLFVNLQLDLAARDGKALAATTDEQPFAKDREFCFEAVYFQSLWSAEKYSIIARAQRS